ncbi:MAG: metallophosphoesterase [Verrucomicrobia bacterium]|nr:metallophosphoesterase [Verrucomicrobiota bacterium]
MNTESKNTNQSGGFSRRQFLGKSILASALAGTWLTNSITSVKAEDKAENKPAEYKAPELSDKDAFSIVVIPDTQTYIKTARNQGICELMTAWIAENIQKLNILTALQVGDLVERNGITEEDLETKIMDQISSQQWNAISAAMSRLDGKLPYVACTGNHDYGIRAAENRTTQFPTYFPAYRNTAWKGVLVECCPNCFGVKTLENAAYEFTTKQGKKILVISLQFAPADFAIEWAKKVVAREEYKDHFVIILTHSYLRSYLEDCKIGGKEGYKVTDVNYGEDIWNKLIYPADNIRMVICGHIAHPTDPKGNVGFRQSKNHAGKTVSQMLFDTQTVGGGWHGNGGDGWLRLLEFSPDLKTVKAKTFSPLFAISPSTQYLAWGHEDYNEFEFALD